MKTIVWDVDDVLNNLMGEWLNHSWRIESPECRVEYSMITQNPPHEILGITKETYLVSLDTFRAEKFAHMKPVPEVLSWFQTHGHRARHIVLTAVPLSFAPISASWVMANFGEWIRSFNVVPSSRGNTDLEKNSETKAEFLRNFARVDFVIDDNTAVIDSVREMGLNAIQMPRPWNSEEGFLTDVLERLTRSLSLN